MAGLRYYVLQIGVLAIMNSMAAHAVTPVKSLAPLSCPAHQTLYEYLILEDASYHTQVYSDFNSSDILSYGTFHGVQARYKGGHIDCDLHRYNVNMFAWQSCRAFWDVYMGAGFELAINRSYVFQQPTSRLPAQGCSELDSERFSNGPVTCNGTFTIQKGDTIALGWFASEFPEEHTGPVYGSLGTITIDLVGLRCQDTIPLCTDTQAPNSTICLPPPAVVTRKCLDTAPTYRQSAVNAQPMACTEEDALRCHATAFCEDFGAGGVCTCPEGSIGDGLAPHLGGCGCSRESWALRVSFDISNPELTAAGNRLDHWERDRAEFTNILFVNPGTEKPFWFDTSVVHTVTEGQFVTIFALFFSKEEADKAMELFNARTSFNQNGRRNGVTPLFGDNNPRLTTDPQVYTFVSATSEAELQTSPTGMDVQNVFYDRSSGRWVVDLKYTTGKDNFNVFYLPKAIGNDTLSFDFDYTAIPDYARKYSKSPADTFLPLNFPCGSDGSTYQPKPHISDRVSACCLEEFAELYRPVSSFVSDPHVREVLGAARHDTCSGPIPCASEGGVCTCDGRVQFGADGSFAYKESDGTILCTTEVFGDPRPGAAKNCSCSPRRQVWSELDRPKDALYGNFSGLSNRTFVEFRSIEDPYIMQYTARLYLDEIELRQKAGILSGAVGVAHSIDTFIGFANFKPTGLEFLDVFAMQVNIHFERTNFFTVSAYGENDYTFLEYVNLRLVEVYKERTQAELDAEAASRPDSFDDREHHLTTSFRPYPESAARGSTLLGQGSRVWITEDASGSYVVHYHLTDLRANETSGGLHVHAGLTCDSHDQVLGHYFSTQDDTWTQSVWTKPEGLTVASGSVRVENPGFGLDMNVGHAFVVHEQSGARIACGILYEVQAGLDRTSPVDAAHYLQVTFTLGEQYQPIETGLIPTDSVLVSKGEFITSPDTLETRFPACQQYADGTFPRLLEFDSRFPTENSQTCAPNATMCYSPSFIPDQFVSFNVPLGIDWLPSPSNDLDRNVFVDMVVSVIDTRQIAVPGGVPNNGDPAEQMKTTLKASIPVVDGGTYVFCDRIEVVKDLLEWATADLVLGSASGFSEFERLRILRDKSFVPDDLPPTNDTSIFFETDSIEAGLMTLVVKGNVSFFESQPDFSLEVEDLMTLHFMEPGLDKYLAVLDLLNARPSGDPDDAVDGFAISGAFYLDIDRVSNRARLEPTDELFAICSFLPQRPNPDDIFPSTCVMRRDMRDRTFPVGADGNASALELPPAGTPLNSPALDNCARFMQDMLGPSDYADKLGRNYSVVVAEKFALNGRYLRAFWINPGYEWAPAQIGNQDKFTLSQRIILFALISLDEGRDVRRRQLLQSASDPEAQASTGLSGQQITFATSPQSMLADLYNVPEELVGLFQVQLQLTTQQACLDPTPLRLSLRSTLDAHLAATATRSETVQVASMKIDRADVVCSRPSLLRRHLLAGPFSGATATVDMLVVFSSVDHVGINLQAFANLEDVVSVTPLKLSDSIRVTTDPLPTTDTDTFHSNGAHVFDPADSSPDDDADEGQSQAKAEAVWFSGWVLIAICGAAGLAVLAGALFGYQQYQRRVERECPVIESIHIKDLRAELALP